MDNVKEYMAIAQVFEAESVEAEFMIIYSLDKNRVTGQLNQMIFNMVRAMFEGANM